MRYIAFFFFSSRRRHTRFDCDWSSDVCSSDLVDMQGNVWIADFAGNKAGTKGHQVHKFSSKGEKLLSLGVAGKASNADGEFNQPNDIVVGPDGSIYVADGHEAQGMITANAVAEGIKRGATSRISKFSPDGKFIKSWGGIGVRHGEFRTPH